MLCFKVRPCGWWRMSQQLGTVSSQQAFLSPWFNTEKPTLNAPNTGKRASGEENHFPQDKVTSILGWQVGSMMGVWVRGRESWRIFILLLTKCELFFLTCLLFWNEVLPYVISSGEESCQREYGRYENSRAGELYIVGQIRRCCLGAPHDNYEA